MSLSRDFRPFREPMFLATLAAVLVGMAGIGAVIFVGTS